jgi:hypothetical protein
LPKGAIRENFSPDTTDSAIREISSCVQSPNAFYVEKQKALLHIYNFTSCFLSKFELTGKAEAGSAGEQPARNNLIRLEWSKG